MDFLTFFDQFGSSIKFVALVIVGYIFGRMAEARHYQSIKQRERLSQNILIFSNRFPPLHPVPLTSELVSGSVVISDDYFKQILSALYSLLGGRIKSYESLLDRARREAVLRMKEQAQKKNSQMIINVKFQTFAVPGSQINMGAVELLAYGTALTFDNTQPVVKENS